MPLFRQLVDEKVLNILDLLLKNKKEFFHLSKISKIAKVPVATTSRIVDDLVSIGVIERVLIDKTKIYRIKDNKDSEELEKVLKIK